MIDLICNECGRYLGALNGLAEFEAVWPLLEACGWGGRPSPQGPHACPRCASAALPSVDDLTAALDPTSDAAGQSHPFCAHLEVFSEATLVVVSGDLTEPVLASVQDVLGAAVAMDRDVIVDLGQVGVVDAAGLRTLVRAHCDARKRDRVLCVAAPSRFIRIVLHTMRLDGAILTFDDRRLARVWLASQRMEESAPAAAVKNWRLGQ
ncbi:MAG: STAS domain-containing protein [Micromonosporaceae bacterium]|nr:STAS domain-containing protein [Micromonosporaceae bacterium]